MKSIQTKYKTTNIPWLPTVPEDWDLVKTKFLFNERVQKGFDAEPLLAATQSQGVIPKSLYETNTVTAQKDFHLLKLVTVGDFVISLRSFQGGIEYAYYRGIISPAYTVFFSKNTEEINPQFFRYFFKSLPFVKSLTLFVTGIREGQNIDYNEFKNSLLPLPPIDEQNAIANYLDGQNEKINLFIAKKQKLIALLKEQKQAIINNAVTKGINEKVELKPSGIDWLGSVPENWSIKKLKFVAKVIFSNVDKLTVENEISVELCNYVDVYKNDYIDNSIEFMKATALQSEIDKFKLEIGDILVTKDSETPNDIAVPSLVVKSGQRNPLFSEQIDPLLYGRYFLVG